MKKLLAVGRRAKELIASANVPMNGSKLPEDGMTTRQIALARCDHLMDRYFREKVVNHRKSDRAQMVTLICTAMTPVVLLLPWSSVNLFGAAVSAIAAIATGYLAITNSRENYIRYGHTWHTLQTEKYRYLTYATKEYADSDEEKAARHFARRIEQLVMAEVTDWRAEMQRVEQQDFDGARQTSGVLDPNGAPRAPGAPDPNGAPQTSGAPDPNGARQTSGVLDPNGAPQTSGASARQTSGVLDPNSARQTSGVLDPNGAPQTSGAPDPNSARQTSGVLDPNGAPQTRKS